MPKDIYGLSLDPKVSEPSGVERKVVYCSERVSKNEFNVVVASEKLAC